MTPTVQKYIEKLKEYNLWLIEWLLYYIQTDKFYKKSQKFRRQLAHLEQQIQEETITEKCTCKKSEFTRMVDDDFNPLCGRCGKPI